MGNYSRMVTLGDSVTWGQGLLSQNKFSSLVAGALGIASSSASLLAHSGACIGVTNPSPVTSTTPEIPSPSPLIIDQIGQTSSPDTIDLVLLIGGINDVSVQAIVDPFTSLTDLRRATKQACYLDMKVLLAKVSAVFTKPTAKFCVIGYYPILSPQSNPVPGLAGDPLVHLLGNFGCGFPLTLDRNDILKDLSDRAMQFWTDSDSFLKQAVLETGSNRFSFIPTPFTPDNALFAPHPLLWGFGPDMGPQDEVAAQRGAACDIQYSSPFEFVQCEICHLASVGHPTVAGARVISQAILNAL